MDKLPNVMHRYVLMNMCSPFLENNLISANILFRALPWSLDYFEQMVASSGQFLALFIIVEIKIILNVVSITNIFADRFILDTLKFTAVDRIWDSHAIQLYLLSSPLLPVSSLAKKYLIAILHFLPRFNNWQSGWLYDRTSIKNISLRVLNLRLFSSLPMLVRLD